MDSNNVNTGFEPVSPSTLTNYILRTGLEPVIDLAGIQGIEPRSADSESTVLAVRRYPNKNWSTLSDSNRFPKLGRLVC